MRSLVPGHDAVINFAAETHVDRSISVAAPFVATNVAGVQVLMQACLDAGVGPVIQVSTDEVYGSIASGSWTEQAPLQPNSPYSAAKAGGDLMAMAYARTHGLDVRITRCCNNYGPYQHPEKVIPLFVTNLLDGRPVPLYGDGGNVRGWIHVDDHCRGIQLVLEHGHPGDTYHINGDIELTNVELTAALLECCGAGWDMVARVPDRKGHDRRYSLDDNALRAMGYCAACPVPPGLEATVRWYADNRDWWEPLKRPGAAPGPRPRHFGHRVRAMTRWLVAGASGMLGTDLVAALASLGESVTGMDRARLDVTDAASVTDAITCHRPERGRKLRGLDRRRRRRSGRGASAGRQCWRGGQPGCELRGKRSPHGAGLYRLRIRRRRMPTVCRRRCPGASHCLRTHEASRRAGRARPIARIRLRGADGVALRGAWAELRPYHD